MAFEDLREALVWYRENRLPSKYRETDELRKEGILRRSMIDYFVKYEPTSMEEFKATIDHHLRQKTSQHQINCELPRLLQFIRDECADLENRSKRQVNSRVIIRL